VEIRASSSSDSARTACLADGSSSLQSSFLPALPDFFLLFLAGADAFAGLLDASGSTSAASSSCSRDENAG
jgi:hypothetical protein